MPPLTVTPGVQTNTRVQAWCPEAVCQQSRWGEMRAMASQNKIRLADSNTASQVRFWPTGCYSLGLVQEDESYSYEQIPIGLIPDNYQYLNPVHAISHAFLSYLGLATSPVALYNTWSEPIGVGFDSNPDVQAKGNKYYRKQIVAGTSWNVAVPTSLKSPTDSTYSGPISGTQLLPSPSVDMDCEMYSTQSSPANQPFCLKWTVPGVQINSPDYVFIFYFGQYCLAVRGDGQAVLLEYCQPAGGGTYRFVKRSTFYYCSPGKALGHPHKLIIYPQVGRKREKFLIFSSPELDSLLSSPMIGLHDSSTPGRLIGNDYVYCADDTIRLRDVVDGPTAATKEAPIRLDVRRDLRLVWQVQALMFWQQGFIQDSPFSVPDYSAPEEDGFPFDLDINATYPVDPFGNRGTVSGTPKDADTGLTSDIRNPYVEFTLTGALPPGISANPRTASFQSPLLWGYGLSREAVITTVAPTPFTMPVHQVSIQDIAGPDPRAENGRALIRDSKGLFHDELANASQFPARLLMDYSPTLGGTPAPIVLARGYCLRPSGTRYGKPSKNYPAAKAFEWDLLFSGVSDRASAIESRSIAWEAFYKAPDADIPTSGPEAGLQPTWRVTDVLRYLLTTRGFLDEQILIDTNPIRLWPGAVNALSELQYDLNTDIIDQCVTLCKNYLGGRLIWDVNSGPPDSAVTGNMADTLPMGAWRLLYPPPSNASPVYNFVMGMQKSASSGSVYAPYSAGAYNALTTWMEARFSVKCDKPEGNHLQVFTAPPIDGDGQFRYEAHAYNALSYSVPGMTLQPDLANKTPHFLGFERIMIVPDSSLIVPNDAEKTQHIVNWTTRRIFDYACVARQLYTFPAPLAIITDADTGGYRPLRHYDPVTIEGIGGFYVRTVSHHITSANHMSMYEVERLVPYP